MRTAAGFAVLGLCAAGLMAGPWALLRAGAETPDRVDPAAWGSDHVSKPMPAFEDGNTCLFCHRNDVGNTWQSNPHSVTIREAAGEAALEALRAVIDGEVFANETGFVLGHDERQRYLKHGAGYGKMDMLSVHYLPGDGGAGRVLHTEAPHWDSGVFGPNCAGCHTSGVDSRDHTFFALNNDCFTCHGIVPQAHTTRPELAMLAPSRRIDARLVASICGSCHLRGGTSRSTGLPYPNNYVAGDNLFRDFEVAWDDEAWASMDVSDRHVYRNTRDIAVFGKHDITCLTCHDVHTNSTARHTMLERGSLCWDCHRENDDGTLSTLEYERFSAVCRYERPTAAQE